jgi:hypothetical protein
MKKERYKKSPLQTETPNKTANPLEIEIGFGFFEYQCALLLWRPDDENEIDKFDKFANAVYKILDNYRGAARGRPDYRILVTQTEYWAAVQTILNGEKTDSKERLYLEEKAHNILSDLFYQMMTHAYARGPHIVKKLKNNEVREMVEREVFEKKEGRENQEQIDIAVERMPEATERYSLVEIIVSAASQLRTLDACRESLAAIQQRARELGYQEPTAEEQVLGTIRNIIRDPNYLRRIQIAVEDKFDDLAEQGVKIDPPKSISVSTTRGRLEFQAQTVINGKRDTKRFPDSIPEDFDISDYRISHRAKQELKKQGRL